MKMAIIYKKIFDEETESEEVCNFSDVSSSVSSTELSDVSDFILLDLSESELSVSGNIEIEKPFHWNIAVDVHAKDTDTHCTLQPSSCHIEHCHRGNITSSAVRIRSICDDQFIDASMKKYKAYLIARDHDVVKVNNIFNKYRNMTKEQALKLWEARTHCNNWKPFKRNKKWSNNSISTDNSINSNNDQVIINFV